MEFQKLEEFLRRFEKTGPQTAKACIIDTLDQSNRKDFENCDCCNPYCSCVGDTCPDRPGCENDNPCYDNLSD